MIARLALAAALVVGLTASPAEAERDRDYCRTAEADVADCLAKGWVMRPFVHVNHDGYVRYITDLEPCPAYDGSSYSQDCYWNHRAWGGGELGESYVNSGRFFMIVNGFRLGNRR